LGSHNSEFYAEMWGTLHKRKYWCGELWNRRKNGQIYAEMLTISAVDDSAGDVRNYVALFTDVTLMKEHEHELEHIAHYDVRYRTTQSGVAFRPAAPGHSRKLNAIAQWVGQCVLDHGFQIRPHLWSQRRRPVVNCLAQNEGFAARGRTLRPA